LLRAFELVRREVDASLIVFGEGPERPRLGDLVNRHGLKDAVSLPGFIANPVSEIKAANLFVLSSRWEGFGNVIVEALGAGTPVVAVDCRSGPAEILDDGRYGRLAIPEDPYDLAKKILAELDEPTPAEILRKRALDFSPAFIARQYLSLLEIDS
jgi:glycosyltransferase involved in cell wall biosynthesis